MGLADCELGHVGAVLVLQLQLSQVHFLVYKTRAEQEITFKALFSSDILHEGPCPIGTQQLFDSQALFFPKVLHFYFKKLHVPVALECLPPAPLEPWVM